MRKEIQMRVRKIASLAGAALLALAGPALAVEALKVTPPKIEVREHQLANGLKVLLHEDHSVPVVNVQVIFSVGSKNERQGRSGFAHLFEHIMFKGSENLGPQEHSDFVTSIGGVVNAGTDFDRTVYYQTIPSNYLERILWMEADRLRSLDVSEENFKSERDVVKEERRLRIENPPFGRLLDVVLSNTYLVHPYRSLPIGSMADLDAATLQDVRDFHSTWYVPSNATLVISGDFDPAETLKWIEKYFGVIPKGKPLVREIQQEPAQTAERRVTDYHPNTPLPAVLFTYHIPEAGHPDMYPLLVVSNILSQGESSRLHRKLVYEKQIAIAAGGQALELDDPGVFFFFSILQTGQTTPEVAEKLLLDEAERLTTEPVSAEELAKGKNQIISGLVFGRESVEEKANAIGYTATVLGDVSLINRQLAEYQKVTAADVQRVAKKYFTPENRTVVFMLPEALRPQGESKPAAESEVKKQ
jgi:zinc protease